MSIKAKRLIASFIDFYIVCFIIEAIFYLYVFLSDVKYPSYNMFLIAFIAAFILLLLRDNIFRNASIGKKILKIKIVKTNDTKLRFIDKIKRNLLILLLPLETLLIITDNKRLGDFWAKTIIVENDYKNCLNI